MVAGMVAAYMAFGQGAAMIYASSLEKQADTALKVRMGEQETFLRDFEVNLPGDLQAVHSFGNRPFVRTALQKVRAYYEVTGTPIPREAADVLSNLPATEKSRSLLLDKATRLRVGDASPVLSLQSIDGGVIDLKEKVVVINLFATWCGPCLRELPHLESDMATLQDKGLVLIGVGRGHSISQLQEFRMQKHCSFPLVADPESRTYEQFAAQYIPQCILIGKDGRIKGQTVGFEAEDYSKFLKLVQTELAR